MSRGPIWRAALAGVCAAAVLLTGGFVGGCARRGDPAGPSDDGSVGYSLVGTVPIAGYAEGVEVEGETVLVAAGEGGLVLFDATDPAAPAYLGTASNDFVSYRCAYAPTAEVAFVTDGPNGVLAFDVGDPASPSWKTILQSTSGQDVVAVETDPGELIHIYVADKNGGFRIWEMDVSYAPPWFPFQTFHGYPEGYAKGLCLHDGHALVAAGQTGLTVYELVDATSAIEVGEVDTPGNALSVTASGDYAFVADGLGGLAVVALADSAGPALVASLELDDYAADICYSNGRVFVAARYGGLRVVDVSDPESPREVGSLDTPYANGVRAAGDFVYVADRDWGLVITEEN